MIAPCTANTLSKIAYGQSDNMLTSTVLAARCPILLCPTMDGEMYESSAVTENLKKIRSMGHYVLEPETGYLASGLDAKGRLPEMQKILDTSEEIIKKHRIQGPLTGKKVVVTAGPTREFLDPVRFISNPSSGKMGLAMAEAARILGGNVHLLHGPVQGDMPDRFQKESFVSAEDLFELVKNHSDADVVIMAAAVSDFRPAERYPHKKKKEKSERSIELVENPDILKWLGDQKNEGQILIGFAMETENLKENALKKLKKKNLDWICANALNVENSGFEADKNTVLLIGTEVEERYSGTKTEVAKKLLEKIFIPDE